MQRQNGYITPETDWFSKSLMVLLFLKTVSAGGVILCNNNIRYNNNIIRFMNEQLSTIVPPQARNFVYLVEGERGYGLQGSRQPGGGVLL